MKTVTLLGATCVVALTVAVATTRAAQGALIWSDEFNQADNSAPDANKWVYELGGGGWGNNELETYTSTRDNSYIASDPDATDGKVLVIQAVKSSTGAYTSARLKTQGKFDAQYGRIEARLKSTNGQGLWPAFWMLGEGISTVGWPACGELDIMEIINANPTKTYGTAHGPGYSGSNGIGNNYILPGGDTYDQAYHVFALDWAPNKIVWSVDGIVYHTITPASLPAGTTWVYNNAPFFILLNLAVGGSWPGNPDGTTVLPQALKIDYVRVYALPPAAPATVVGYAVDSTNVALSWTTAINPDGAAASGYRLERATDSAFSQNLTHVDLGAVTSYIDTSATAGTTYYYRLSTLERGGVSDPSNTFTVQTAAANPTGSAKLVNISARASGRTGNNVAIGGLGIAGTTSKRVLLRAVGPSLTTQGIGATQVMLDPTIELHDALQNNIVIGTNDNWSDNTNAAAITAAAAQVGAFALASDDTKSSAMLLDMQPGVYSFIAPGKNSTSGIVLVEVYDADIANPASALVNISARIYCSTGDNVAIGGFGIAGSGEKHVLLRAVGPTLTTQGLGAGEVLTDPSIEVHDALHGNGVIATNDNWGDNSNASAIVGTITHVGAAPFSQGDATSSAMLLTLPAGVYSFVVRGQGSTTGIVLVEVYDAD